MPDDRIASLLLMLAPLWPVVAAVVLSFPRNARSDHDALGIDRECRAVATLAAALSCGSLLAAMLLTSTEVRAPDLDLRSAWFVIPAASDILVTFQLRMDILSGPAAIAATLLACVAVLSQRRTVATVNQAAAYGRWMLLLSAVQILLLANDLVLLAAAIIVSEMLCRSLIPKPLSWVRTLTLFPFLWIILQWLVGFTRHSVDAAASANLWRMMGEQQPIFALTSGLCLLTFVMGRSGLYPFCADVDRVYDDTPGRLFWFGCLGSWIPAQYLLLRFWPVLGASTLGVPSLASLAVLLTILSAWMALARPHRVGSLALIGAGMLAVPIWTALGSGHSSGFWIAASASLSLLLLFGGLIILADASGWLNDQFTPRRVPGRRTLWVAIILLSSGIGVQQAWEVTFEMSRQVDSPDASAVAESVGGELIEIPASRIHAALPIVMVLAHGLLWLAAGRVLSPILLGLTPRRPAVVDEPAEVADVILPTYRASSVDEPAEAATAAPGPIAALVTVPHSAAASTWFARRLCGGLVLCAVLWGPAWAELRRSRGDGTTAEFVMRLTAAPWGVMLSAGLLGLVVGCWIGFAISRRPSLSTEPWQKLADAGRRLFYLPEIGRSLMLPFRQLLELPVMLESLRIPTAEILSDQTVVPVTPEQELPASVAAAWLLPLAGLWSVAVIWTLLLIW